MAKSIYRYITVGLDEDGNKTDLIEDGEGHILAKNEEEVRIRVASASDLDTDEYGRTWKILVSLF